MKDSFVIPQINSQLPQYSKYTPLYDIDTMVFRTPERERIFVGKAHTKFRKYFEDNNINVDRYMSSSKYIGPFNVWEHIYQYKPTDMAIHNVLGTTILGLVNFDLDFTFETSEDAKNFYNKVTSTLKTYKLEHFIDASLKVNGPIVSKSCKGKLGPGQLVAWCASIKEFVNDTKTPIMVELTVLPESQWWGKRTKRDWVLCDENGSMWVFGNCEYIVK